MKKSIILGLIGMAAAAASSFGQGGVFFANYNGGPIGGGPITYGTPSGVAGKDGLAVGSSFSAELYYFNSGTASWTALPSTITPFFGNADGDLGSGAGFFNLGATTVPVLGSVQLEVYAFNTVAVGTFQPGQISGFSAPFTITSVDPQSPSYPDFSGTTYSAFSVVAIPEPSAMVLAGLGSAALLIFRRRRN